jgi:tryptophan 7-halogenase
VGVGILEETVGGVEQDEGGIRALACRSGRRCEADFYVDASGFASLLLGRTLQEPFRSFAGALYCDQAVTGGWKRGEQEVIRPYTTCETMDSGWCWRIDHEETINRGYVYSSAFITAEEAEREFRAKNPQVNETRLVKFRSGAYERAWVKNVVAIGNAAGFLEPLEATALGFICRQARTVAHALARGETALLPGTAAAYNHWHRALWEGTRDFLAVHYRYNERLDTPFWRACRRDVDLGYAAELMAYYRDGGPEVFSLQLFGPEVFDLNGYLSLLVGMKVPYRGRPAIPAEHRQRWETWRGQVRAAGMAGLSVREALDILRGAEVNWGNFFQPA